MPFSPSSSNIWACARSALLKINSAAKEVLSRSLLDLLGFLGSSISDSALASVSLSVPSPTSSSVSLSVSSAVPSPASSPVLLSASSSESPTPSSELSWILFKLSFQYSGVHFLKCWFYIGQRTMIIKELIFSYLLFLFPLFFQVLTLMGSDKDPSHYVVHMRRWWKTFHFKPVLFIICKQIRHPCLCPMQKTRACLSWLFWISSCVIKFSQFAKFKFSGIWPFMSFKTGRFLICFPE